MSSSAPRAPGSAVRDRGFLERPDASLYYEVTGSGPGLIFAHGLGGNHLSWWQQVPHFAGRYTCVTFSHRGFIPSRIHAGGAAAAAFADDLAALVDHLKFDRVALVCQSMGGWSGLAYAQQAPERVAALVMASTSGRIDFTTVAEPEAQRLRQWVTDSAAARGALAEQGVHPAVGLRGAREQPAPHFLYQQIDRLTPPEIKERMRAEIFGNRTQSAATLGAVKVPVLYLVGEEDVVFPAAAAEPLARLTPGARVVRVPQSGHSVYFERPQDFNRIVDEFLARTLGIPMRG